MKYNFDFNLGDLLKTGEGGGGNWGQFKTSILVPTFNANGSPPHIATAVQSFGEGNSDSDCYRGKTKSTPSTGV